MAADDNGIIIQDYPTSRLSHSAGLARGDLVMYMKHVPVHVHWRALQTIRMITEDIGDRENFELIWERWRNEDRSFVYLPPFKELMKKD